MGAGFQVTSATTKPNTIGVQKQQQQKKNDNNDKKLYVAIGPRLNDLTRPEVVRVILCM